MKAVAWAPVARDRTSGGVADQLTKSPGIRVPDGVTTKTTVDPVAAAMVVVNGTPASSPVQLVCSRVPPSRG